MNSENNGLGFFTKKQSTASNKKIDNSYKDMASPLASFNPEDLQNNDDITILKTNNKSLVIPAEIWCEFMAALEISESDYTYELLAELTDTFKQKLDKVTQDKYNREVEFLKNKQIEKYKKKQRNKL